MDDIMSVKRFALSIVLFVAVTSLTSPVLLCEGNRSKSAPAKEESVKSSEKVTTGREVNPTNAPVADSSPEAIVYYFHGYQRCWTCRRIEELAHFALQEGFPDDLENGRLQWQVVNMEAEGNDHFVDDYSLFSKALVVQKVREGKNAEWKNLQRIWELVRDEQDFVRYVQDEVSSLLGEVQ